MDEYMSLSNTPNVSNALSDALISFASNLESYAEIINQYSNDINSMKIISILLMIAAITLFIVLIFISLTKKFIRFLIKGPEDNPSRTIKRRRHAGVSHANNSISAPGKATGFFADEEYDDEFEEPENYQINKEPNEEEFKERENLFKEEKTNESEKEKTQERSRKKEKDLDWNKNKKQEDRTLGQTSIAQNSIYVQEKKNLSSLIGLMIDMMGRNIDDNKIAQTLVHKSEGCSSEDDIMQMISSVNEFIEQCREGTFKSAIENKSLPDEYVCLQQLAYGDPAASLLLIESHINEEIQKVRQMEDGPMKTNALVNISNLSCEFGTIATIGDINLAINSFELASELHPKNVNAWSRLGDMYNNIGAKNKSIWAYQNTLNLADKDINSQQVANANKSLSEIYHEQGNSALSAKLYNESKSYYEEIGIVHSLDESELEVVDIIQSRQKDELENTLFKLLGQQR